MAYETIKLDFFSFILATIPLWVAIFSGAWVLLRLLIFKPLNEISNDLKDIKKHIFSHDRRITVLETEIKKQN